MKKYQIATLFIAATLLAGCGNTTNNTPKVPAEYKAVAQCLTQKGVIMYGAYWCPHCADQKALFGEYLAEVHYQECDDKGPNGNKLTCVQAGVSSYPTWFFPGQGNLEGVQPVPVLAKIANCDDKLSKEDQDKLKEAEKKAEEEAAKAAKDGQNGAAGAPAAGSATTTVPATGVPTTGSAAAPAIEAGKTTEVAPGVSVTPQSSPTITVNPTSSAVIPATEPGSTPTPSTK